LIDDLEMKAASVPMRTSSAPAGQRPASQGLSLQGSPLTRFFWVLAVLVLFSGQNSPLFAQSLEAALARAYALNPDLNAARANTRAVDENVPSAKSGYRPKLSVTGDAGLSNTESKVSGRESTTDLVPRGAGASLDQTLFNGFRTENSVSAAEAGVFAARASLRNSEQNILLDAVTAYMNVVRDEAIYTLRQNNVAVLSEQLRQTRDRFTVGEITRTDVAQSESRLARARSDSALAQSNLKSSQARFKQVIGIEAKKLAQAQPVAAGKLPRSQGDALNIAMRDHPAIVAALHGVDAQSLQVKVVEGELYPTIGVRGSLTRRYDSQVENDRRNTASVVGSVTIPLYDGGSAYARTRQAKETLGERRLQVDSAREKVIAAVISSWSLLEATGFQIEGASAQVRSSEIALSGVREEARVGQRTTLDVLNAQQEVLDSRVALVTAQRDRVVASYGLLSATGKLSAQALNLKVAAYDPRVHFDAVKDSWLGLRTPSGE
jgi:outer membrane protein